MYAFAVAALHNKVSIRQAQTRRWATEFYL